jgi:transcriptional regulator with XRE-family HTH domain
MSVVSLQRSEKPNFGDALTFALRQLNMTQEQLAFKADVSQSLVSRIARSERPLTLAVAEKLGNVLGSSPETLMRLDEEMRQGSNRLINLIVAEMLGGPMPAGEQKKVIGTQVRRLWRQDILHLFDRDEDAIETVLGDEDHCQISFFDPSRVKEASYDTRVGGYGEWLPQVERWNFLNPEADGSVKIPAGETRFVCTMENVALPSWLEAELCAAFNIARKGLLQLKGPVINPLWSGKVVVGLVNLGKGDVEITPEEPFLTLRFWLAKL